MTSPFPEHLQGMNDEQLRAVTTVNGPLLILAGAGSGKTRVLTRRIAHLLHLGVSAEAVLAVTFTNKAATEMKERVADLVGDSGKKVWVSTFHSSCVRILRQDGEALGYTKRFAIYDDDDQKRLLKQIIQDQGLDPQQVLPKDVLSRIDQYKNRLMTPDEVLRERRSHINDPTLRVWRLYEEALRAADAMDFNDLIGQTVRLLAEHEEVRQRWRERFHYVMVDEYQDTNLGQYRLLRLLADGHRNLAVVGDDDQSIYGFRGADVTNILNFERDFPDATVVRLEQNYRSTANILALANAVVAKNEGRLAKALWTKEQQGAPIRLIEHETPDEEAGWVTAAIQKLRRESGYTWGDFAVIYRTNAMARPVERKLTEQRIPFRIVGGRKFYERREVRDLLGYLRLVQNPADDAAFLRVVNVPPRGVGPKLLSKLRQEAANRGQPLLRTARGFGSVKAEAGLAAFVALIDRLEATARERSPAEVVETALVESGYQAMLEADGKGETKEENAERLSAVRQLVEDATRSVSNAELATPFERLTAWLDSVALAGEAEEPAAGGAVTLLTVHSAKGLEYPVVFVVQMSEGTFPHARSLDNGVEEERRLCYVAFTRARQRLLVSRSRLLASQGGTRGETAPASRFLFGLPPTIIVGDAPDGDAVADNGRKTGMSPNDRRQLAAMLQRVRATSTPAPPRSAPARGEVPPQTYQLRDLERAEQLRKGVRVFHDRLGAGTVLSATSARVQVAFDSGTRSQVGLGEGALHLLVD